MTKLEMIAVVKGLRDRGSCNFHDLPKDFDYTYVTWTYRAATDSVRPAMIGDSDFYQSGWNALLKRLELENTKLHKALE